MVGELLRIAGQCDGVRCDMAMLVLPDIFERTWGRRAPLFWPDAIGRVREKVPGFCFMAEVYWDHEWTMQQKVRLRLRQAAVRSAPRGSRPAGAGASPAGLDYQEKLARFIENHDEPRAAAASRGKCMGGRRAQLPLARTAVLPSGPVRRPQETHLAAPGFARRTRPPTNRSSGSTNVCERCCSIRPVGTANGGCWSARPHGRTTGRGTVLLRGSGRAPLATASSYRQLRNNQSQCYVRVPLHDLGGRSVRFKDLMGPVGTVGFDRDRGDLDARGLFLDVPAWGYHVFDVTA